MQSLATMRAALEKRNREMAAKVNALFHDRLQADGPAWNDIRSLTPRGNVTERHVAWATLNRLRQLAAERGRPLDELLEQCCGAAPPADDEATLQIYVRAKLLKAGAPCFVPESEAAFVSLEELRDIFLAFGAIPTYPVLGNPVTEAERNIEALLDRLQELGIYAIEVIPNRNTRERLQEIVRAAKRRWWPVFNGTEHNTPEARPLLDPFALDPEFEPWFRQSTELLLGHQRLAARGHEGFVRVDGRPSIADARLRFEFFSEAGKLNLHQPLVGAPTTDPTCTRGPHN